MTLDDLRRNRNLLFWGLHAFGWSACLITQYMGALLYDQSASYMKVVLVAAASGFLLSAWINASAVERHGRPLGNERLNANDSLHYPRHSEWQVRTRSQSARWVPRYPSN